MQICQEGCLGPGERPCIRISSLVKVVQIYSTCTSGKANDNLLVAMS